jgi:hypothetical protein
LSIPTVNASAQNQASLSSTVDVSITITSSAGRVLIGFGFVWTGSETDNFSSVVFDPGGGDEASFSYEAQSRNVYTGGAEMLSEAWSLVLDDGVSSGTYTVRFTFASVATRIQGHVWETDANTTDPVGASGSGTGSGTTALVDVTTTAANSLVAGALILRSNTTFTPGADDTEELEFALGNNSTWSGYTPAASINTYTVSATADVDGGAWAMVGVELKEAAGGGATEETASAAIHKAASVASQIDAQNSATLARSQAVAPDESLIVDASVSLSRSLGAGAEGIAGAIIEESVTLNIFQSCTQPLPGGATEETASAARYLGVVIASQVEFSVSLTLNRVDATTPASQVILDESVTVSRVLAQSPNEQGDVENTIALARYLAEAVVSGLSLQDAISLSRHLAALVSSDIEIDAALTLANYLSETVLPQLDAEDALSLARYLTESLATQIEGENVVTLTRHLSVIPSDVPGAEVSVSLGRTMGFSAVSGGELESLLALAQQRVTSLVSDLLAGDSLALDNVLSISATPEIPATEEGVTLSRSLGMSLAISPALAGSLALARSAGLLIDTQLDGVNSLTLSRLDSLSPISQAEFGNAVVLAVVLTILIGGTEGISIGKMSVAYMAKQPGVIYSAKQPGVAYAAKKPGITFED